MKTGEEKFDDEIRQKLRYSEVKPPADLFDTIVPPKNNKKRGFFWLWLTGIVILGITTLAVHFFSGNGDGLLQKNRTSKQDHVNGNVNSSGKITRDESGVSNESLMQGTDPAEITNLETGQNKNEQEHSGTLTNTSNQKSQAGNTQTQAHHDQSGYLSRNDDTNPGIYAGLRRKNEPGNIYNYDILYTPVPSLSYENKFEPRQQLQIIKPDNRPLDMHRPTPYSVEISAMYAGINQKVKSSTEDTLSTRLLEAGKASMDANSGWGVNARLLYALNEKLNLGAGIGYTQRKESMQMVFTDYTQELLVDTFIYYILFPFLPPEQVVEVDSIIYYSEHQHNIKHKLTISTFTFMAGAGYSIPLGAFNIEPGVNVNIDLYTQVSGSSNYNESYSKQNGNDYYDRSVRYGISGNLMLGYSVSEKVTVFLNPAYRYDFNLMKTTPAFYNVKNNQMSLGCGIRYSIFKRHEVKRNMSGPDIVKR